MGARQVDPAEIQRRLAAPGRRASDTAFRDLTEYLERELSSIQRILCDYIEKLKAENRDLRSELAGLRQVIVEEFSVQPHEARRRN